MLLDQESLHRVESHCTQESPPRCRAACPFDLDVRAFMARMAEGRPGEARKVLERHVPLPGIMACICDHPCENVCLRRDLGGSIAIHGLELACMSADVAPGRTLPLPPKRFRMAIVGAGLAGLTAAWDLGRKSYPVTLFHGGALESAILAQYPGLGRPEGLRDFLAEDLERLGRQNVSFVEAELCPALVERAAAEYDAVLVDACSGLAPEEGAVDAETLLWHGNVCCAGWLGRTATGNAFASASGQAGQGRRAAQTLTRITGGTSLTAAREKAAGTLHTDVSGIAAAPRIEPAAGAAGEPLYTPEEAAAEAGRCLQCECMICVRQCVYMQKYKGYPRFFARQIFNNATIVQGIHTANALINGCALCGQCEELCPENFSMSELCLSAREDMVARGFMPPSAHEFALEDMESASGPECSLIVPDSATATPAWLFFPGCQLAASRGAQVAALHGWLRERLNQGKSPGLALMLSCCGMPAHWAGRARIFREHSAKLRASWEELGRPRIITACASCLSALGEALPEARPLSLWEVLDGLDIASLQGLLPQNGSKLPATFSIQDPCTVRHNEPWLRAVRSLATKCGARVTEPLLTGAATACCGYGGLVWCSQPELARAMAEHRAAQLEHPGLASCIMCRDRMAASGKACWHILDLLLPGGAGAGTEQGPGLSARRANRAALRRQLLARYGGGAQDPGEAAAAELARVQVPDDMLPSLEERHILLDDVRGAVLAAEASGHRFQDRESGHWLCSWRPRKVTFWVEYEKRDAGFVVLDAWCHRMIVPGAGGQEADEVIRSNQVTTDGRREERI